LVYAIWFGVGHDALYQAWKLRLKYPVVETAFIFAASIVTVGFIVGMYTGFLIWKRRPRFAKIDGDGPSPPRKFVLFPILFPIVIGLLTLAIFSIHEHWANDGRHDFVMLSPNEVLVFFGVVVVVYTGFTIRTIGILAKRCKNTGDAQ
jgi:formate-dependent nitrite reductase membrane component NrfD